MFIRRLLGIMKCILQIVGRLFSFARLDWIAIPRIPFRQSSTEREDLARCDDDEGNLDEKSGLK